MSPEQTTGERALDGRSDQYSLGCVTYEMLAGEPPFTAPSAQAVVAKILSTDPVPLEERRSRVPAAVAAAVGRALEKLPADRFATAGDFARAIQTGLFQPETGVATSPRTVGSGASGPVGRTATLVVTGVLAILALWGWLRPVGSLAPDPVLRFDIALPADQRLSVPTYRAFPFDLSPDGRTLAYAGVREGTVRLYLRRLDRFETIELPGTEEARQPFFSWEGSRVGFVAGRKLKWVPLNGGSPFVIADAGGTVVGASWGPDDVIVFGAETESGSLRSHLYTVEASGGDPAPLETTLPDHEAPAGGQRTSMPGAWPHHLPVGDRILVGNSGTPDSGPGTYVVHLASREARFVMPGWRAQHVTGGHLAFVQSITAQAVRAVPYDDRSHRIQGDPAPLLENVFRGAANGAHFFRVSRSGTTVFVEEGFRRSVVLVDRTGNERILSREMRGYRWPRFSPEGDEVVVHTTGYGVLSFDTPSGRELPLGNLRFPLFRPDGVLFEGSSGLREHRRGSAGAADTLVTWNQNPTLPTSWAPDGQTVVAQLIAGGTGYDIVRASAATGWQQELVLGSDFNERNARVSPDGRWLAFTTDRSGRDEVWVAPWPSMERPVPVSVGGGTDPLWSPDGSEIFYRSGDRVMAVEVRTSDGLTSSDPVVLFSGDYEVSQTASWDIGPDGRFVMIKLAPGTFRQFKVVYNLAAELGGASDR